MQTWFWQLITVKKNFRVLSLAYHFVKIHALAVMGWFQSCSKDISDLETCASRKKFWKFEFSHTSVKNLAIPKQNFGLTPLASQFWWLSCLGGKTNFQIFTAFFLEVQIIHAHSKSETPLLISKERRKEYLGEYIWCIIRHRPAPTPDGTTMCFILATHTRCQYMYSLHLITSNCSSVVCREYYMQYIMHI